MYILFIFAQVTMETTQHPQESSPSTIYFVEEMKPEYLEYIDSCKERAQTDSAYWQELKESMSRGMISLVDENTDVDNADNVSESGDTFTDTQYDDVSEGSIRSLLEYQIKMLENMNYAIDLLTEKCDELTKYCSKLAKRLKKYSVNSVSNSVIPSTTDVSGIINNNRILPVNMNIPIAAPAILPVQSAPASHIQSEQALHVQGEIPSKIQDEQTYLSDQSVTDETDNSDDSNNDFTETGSVENTNIKQVDV